MRLQIFRTKDNRLEIPHAEIFSDDEDEAEGKDKN